MGQQITEDINFENINRGPSRFFLQSPIFVNLLLILRKKYTYFCEKVFISVKNNCIFSEKVFFFPMKSCNLAKFF